MHRPSITIPPLQRQVMVSNDSRAIIFEDDIDFSPDFPLQLRKIFEAVSGKFDIIMLGHCAESDTGPLTAQITTNNYTVQLRKSQHPYCGHAYAVSRIGARKMLEFLDARFGEQYGPWKGNVHFDSTFSSLRVRKALMYSVFPPIVIQRPTAGKSSSTHKKNFYDRPFGFTSVLDVVLSSREILVHL